MSHSSYLPRPDRKFLAWVINFLKYLMGRIEQFGFPQLLFQQLDEEKAIFANKLEVAEEPSTRNKVNVAEKNTARKALEADIRKAVAEYLTNNHLLTDADRDLLGLPIHKTTRTPVQVATTYPDYDIDSGTIRRLILNFYDQGQKKSKAKPAGQHGAEIRWVISDMPVVDVSELIHSAFDTRTPFTLDFLGHERGKMVYFCLRWENTRGQKGPWSEIISAVIP